ncbi:hypothetical protein NEF87_001055 [Candidatus Lokiarchaeum ossiferum]|uniref:Smr domain-containing protein n=1 Tax=Candidatus Lokiarchaeum ossiferum TaxID=2951803 RepID=A0ABY6HMN5_9ARCH|nr:hypothetical protein NEF87_001055 [Candidatus Lokiarchaeum sp. B-35]
MQIDLHGYNLAEAIEDVCWRATEAVQSGDHVLEIVHGFHRGQVLQTHFTSYAFKQEMQRIGIQIQYDPASSDEGFSVFTMTALAHHIPHQKTYIGR